MVRTRNVLERVMAIDRPDDDFEVRDTRAGQHVRSGGDVPAARAEPAETRSREEYCDALRAADGGSSDAVDSGDDRSGWDSVDAEDRPPAEDIQVSPERRTHILDGDVTGGGHRHATGNPGETEFPASWDDEKIIDTVADVARRPDLPPKHQQWNDRWLARGTRDDVEVVVVILRDGRIWTGWPTPESPGVVKNPKEP
jgi:hypothetical protein